MSTSAPSSMAELTFYHSMTSVHIGRQPAKGFLTLKKTYLFAHSECCRLFRNGDITDFAQHTGWNRAGSGYYYSRYVSWNPTKIEHFCRRPFFRNLSAVVNFRGRPFCRRLGDLLNSEFNLCRAG